MLKKRLVGVVTVRNGWAVQSFGYRRYLPLGRPECLVENLDRWGVDEILVQVIDRTASDLGPDYGLLERLGRLGLGTPLIYGGGIRTIEHGIQAVQLGADRITVDALLHDGAFVVRELANSLGAHAIVASLPSTMVANQVQRFNYQTKTSQPLASDVLGLIMGGAISEVMLTDCENEGTPRGFNTDLIDSFPDQAVPLIVFGGISDAVQVKNLLDRQNVVAAAIGNFLSYREHAIQKYKELLTSTMLRSAIYDSTESSLLADV